MAGNCKRCNAVLGDGAKFCLQCGAMVEVEVADAEDPLIGKILLGRYRINKVLGEGGMGKVYLAEQKMGAATRKVAIKTLRPELGGDPQLVARFHRESETVIELSHPNTIQFFDFGEMEDSTLFIVMEFIQGQALAALLHTVGNVEPARADRILIQVCGSLHEAHQRGIVHRDLKPENVLLTERGGQTDFVKVLDFGIAKRSEAEDQAKGKLTKQGMVLGTPPYMSPEQFSGQQLDARSDIYSLGIMTYEMLTGKLPFDAKTPWEWATKHLTAQPDPIDSTPQGAALPPNKKAAIMKALSKQREQRQATVLEFLQEFTGYQDSQAAWTMATSAGGAILPKDPPGRTPVPTPAPMQGAYGTGPISQPTPSNGIGAPPGYATGQQSYGPPGMSTPSGAGMSYGGGAGGYSSGAGYAPPQQSGGGAGKLIAALLIGVFVIGGGVGGAIWWVSRKPADVLAQGPGPVPNPNSTGVPPVQPVGVGGNGITGQPTVVQQPVVVVQPTVVQPPNPQTNPTNPANPTNPTNPTNPVQPTNPANTENPDRDPRPNRPDRNPDRNPDRTPDRGNADNAQAARMVQAGLDALGRNDMPRGIQAIQEAQRAGGSRDQIAPLQRELGRRGANQVGNFMLRGDCRSAQDLFRQLRSANAEGPSRQHFEGTEDWCPRP